MATPQQEIETCNGLHIVGWRELASLPNWGIVNIKAKIDTGARTSAIHVEDIVELSDDRVRFNVIVPPTEPEAVERKVQVETAVVRISKVRPSTGKRQRRLVVTTLVRLGSVVREIELSLVSRDCMLCPLLLGRRAVAGAFMVDPSSSQRLSGKSKSLIRKGRPLP